MKQSIAKIQRNVKPELAEYGFTYVGVLILIAIMGLISGATVQLGTLLERRAAEEALLAIGMEYRDALVSYANATPVGQSRSPATLNDLLKDPRYPAVRRHLRKIYVDPLTGKEEWGIEPSIENKGILGVYSLSDAKPIKIGNFDGALQNFEGKNSYRDWVFRGLQPPVPPAAVRAASMVPTPSR